MYPWDSESGGRVGEGHGCWGMGTWAHNIILSISIGRKSSIIKSFIYFYFLRGQARGTGRQRKENFKQAPC